MEKLNKVGRLENVFILLKNFIWEKKNFKLSSKKWGWSDESKQTYFFFGPIHFGLLHLFLLALLCQEKYSCDLCLRFPAVNN